MRMSTKNYILSSTDLLNTYGVYPYGPSPLSSNPLSSDYSYSSEFKEISFTIPGHETLTKELIQKVVGAWVKLNLSQQEYTRASYKFTKYVTYLNADLTVSDPNTNRLEKANNALSMAQKNWKTFTDKGYSIKITK